jgi:hypothetical protein
MTLTRTSDDMEILGHTVATRLEDGSIQYGIVLPSGRELKSDPMPPDAKGVAIAWCDAVRNQIATDERIEKDKSRPTAQNPPPQEPLESAERDSTGPRAYVEAEHTKAQQRLLYAQEGSRLAEEALEKAEKDLEMWQAVLDALPKVEEETDGD